RGLIAGWRGGQIASVAGGLVVAVFCVRALPMAPGLVAAVGAVALGVGIATWPVAGRTAEEWAPEVGRHFAGVGSRRAGARLPALPRQFAPLRILEAQIDDGAARGPVAVLHDRAARTYGVVMAAAGPGFALLGRDGQAERIRSWAGLLASLARQGILVHRLQWVERSLPDAGVEIRRHFAARRTPADTDAVRSYAALLDGESLTARRHEVLVLVSVHGGHAARAVRAAGGGDRGACAVVLREAAALCRRLREAGITTAGPLGPRALGAALRRGFDTDASMRGRADAELMAPLLSAGTADAWPSAMTADWGRVRVDGTWHVTYWIAEWPRVDVGPDFLAPLLLGGIRQSVSVVMEPVGPVRAARRVEQARTADIADAELRRRGGFLATARRRREAEVLARRESELADGHGQYRFSGYVTVTVEAEDQLEDACGQVEQAAARAGLELRRCYGDQAHAFTCSLPLGRGLG
ncbi:MAG TPA: SCO6880 family protein, partial [Candidatus Sulfotelmatobacter sp.]|nr:SCO6880 family protein [Candidatus Sulfotelmatobacter sp.]